VNGPRLEPADLDGYLDRVGLADVDRTPTMSTLARVQEAHATHIVFENLDIHLGRGISIDVPSVFEKLVRDKRGGYCFEQNTLLGAALRTLGFEFVELGARVVIGGPPAMPARTHKCLAVAVDGDRWLVDAGFGAATPLCPVPLDATDVATFGAWTWRLEPRDGGMRALQLSQRDGWRDLYVFDEVPQYESDFIVGNHYTSTHPDSGFVRFLTVQRPGPEVQVVLRGTELSEFTLAGVTTTRVEEEDLLDVIRTRFGLQFPAGTVFRSPRGS
jgi:N-hydroxyarylamine O-acetyltransferase